jgi:[acyl-carrier-protein] S-malonyltransferase
MMADLAEASPAAARLFETADQRLGFALSELCFGGPEERLDATDVSQPAIFVCSAAALAALHEAVGERLAAPVMMAGLSLGEYTALYAADAVDFGPALDVVAQRGRLMQQAAEAHPTGMVSIIALDEAKVRELCEAAAEGAVLVPSNFNCPGQIVVSGDAAACRRAADIAKDFGAAGAVPLKVAGAFHSPFMAPAAERLAELLATVPFRQPKWPVISNVDHAIHAGQRRRYLLRNRSRARAGGADAPDPQADQGRQRQLRRRAGQACRRAGLRRVGAERVSERGREHLSHGRQ